MMWDNTRPTMPLLSLSRARRQLSSGQSTLPSLGKESHPGASIQTTAAGAAVEEALLGSRTATLRLSRKTPDLRSARIRFCLAGCAGATSRPHVVSGTVDRGD